MRNAQTPQTTPQSTSPQTAAKAPSKKRQTTVKDQAPASVKSSSKPSTKSVKPSAKTPSAPKAKALKEKKVKVVRDSFTIPKSEFTQIAEMKKRAMALGIDIKKSELIRAGLQAIFSLSDVGFKKALSAVPNLKTGRPSKS